MTDTAGSCKFSAILNKHVEIAAFTEMYTTDAEKKDRCLASRVATSFFPLGIYRTGTLNRTNTLLFAMECTTVLHAIEMSHRSVYILTAAHLLIYKACMMMKPRTDPQGHVPDLGTEDVWFLIVKQAMDAVPGGIVFVDLSTFKNDDVMRGIVEGLRVYSKRVDGKPAPSRIILWHANPVELESTLRLDRRLSIYSKELCVVFPGLRSVRQDR